MLFKIYNAIDFHVRFFKN